MSHKTNLYFIQINCSFLGHNIKLNKGNWQKVIIVQITGNLKKIKLNL